jgi:hypothetical protein
MRIATKTLSFMTVLVFLAAAFPFCCVDHCDCEDTCECAASRQAAESALLHWFGVEPVWSEFAPPAYDLWALPAAIDTDIFRPPEFFV